MIRTRRTNDRPTPAPAALWIGTCGFDYPHWVNVFYPRDLPRREWFAYYARHFDTVELNVTFYRLPHRRTFEAWARQAPEGFCFALKGSRFITHVKRLRDAAGAVANFFENAQLLGGRLRCVLWQLPARFAADANRLREFLRALPGRTLHAFEFRDRSWFTDDVFAALRETNAAIAAADWPFQVLLPGMRPRRIARQAVRVPATADWAYLRRHGPGDRYGGAYTLAMLRSDAEWIRSRHPAFREVFVYFNNDPSGHAVRNALRLRRLVE
ncbi:MAG: DUF72 domain-containing protein [Armatimonadota bacterium]|nr:DUF72 domain-containing protein [Armatimonadota bacterium]MDR5697997.1 DUF72 domain-containing protein [Armatimonadota bacterium]